MKDVVVRGLFHKGLHVCLGVEVLAVLSRTLYRCCRNSKCRFSSCANVEFWCLVTECTFGFLCVFICFFPFLMRDFHRNMINMVIRIILQWWINIKKDHKRQNRGGTRKYISYQTPKFNESAGRETAHRATSTAIKSPR